MLTIPDWLNQVPSKTRYSAVLTIGVFDGLHLGHKYLIGRMVSRAKALGVLSLILTFEPHPLEILSPGSAPEILTTLAQKEELLSSWGVSKLGCLRFDQALSNTKAVDFLNNVLLPYLKPQEIFLGSDFRFGLNAEGHSGLIKDWARGSGQGAKVRLLPQQRGELGEIYASSHIRALLREGLVDLAQKLLGRPYVLSGVITHGLERGRTLGFPTANLGNIVQLVPGPGVYAVRAILGHKSLSAVTSIGHNPTFAGANLTVETHILDFSEDIYDKNMSLEFVAKIRDMIRFDSVEALVEKINEDEKKARDIFQGIAK